MNASLHETGGKARRSPTRAVVLALILCATAALFGACRSGPPALDPSEELPGTSWRLIAMDGRALEHYALPTIAFSAEGISGDTGCNRYSGELELDDNSIKIGTIGMTKRACPPPIMDREARFLELLATVHRAEVTREFLILECAGSVPPLRFRRGL